MIVNKQLAESKGVDQKDLWETPEYIFEMLDREFCFTLDPCCTDESALCSKYFTPEHNGLLQDWQGERIYMNPPYSRGNIDQWAEKAYRESLKPNTTVVGLLPVSTSSDWWKNWIVGKTEKRWVDKRVKFKGGESCAPFSSVIVIFGRSGESTFNQQKSQS